MKFSGPKSTIRRAKHLRRNLTLPEVLLWQELRKSPDGLKFRKQHPAGQYVLDFYCDSVKLAIEVDGEVHARGQQPERDAKRDAWIALRCVRILRIPAVEVLHDLDAAVRHIVDVARG